MKRFYAIVLPFCLLLCALIALSSCGHTHIFENGTLVLPVEKGATGVTEISVCSCGEKQETVIPFGETSKEKWLAMLSPTNYTVDISYVDLAEASYIVTEDGYHAKETLEGFEQYILKEDDGWYSVALVDGEYKSHKIAIEPDLSLGALIMPGMIP